MISTMNMLMVILLVVLAALGGALLAVRLVREQLGRAVSQVQRDAHQQSTMERDAAVAAALKQAALLNREQLGQGLQAQQRDVDQVRDEVRSELARLGLLVQQLTQRSSEQMGQVEASLRAHSEVTSALASNTQSLRQALASPKTRGQWGERMAEDVLRLAGFIEHVNYEKQTSMDGGRQIPDFTFKLPKGHVLYMDVKFPLPAYIRHLDSETDAERSAHLATFLRDVRQRVKELAVRDYGRAGERPAIDYVLLFLPNETISGFIHEHDPELIEFALGHNVVLCSPLTLFAFLGVIRQAFDNFMIEETSDELLKLLGTFSQQWGKFTDSLDTVHKRFDSVAREFEQLNGPRRRQLERPLQQLDALRQERDLPVDGQMFNVYELGA
jgi:DNA recombination protein RmuC